MRSRGPPEQPGARDSGRLRGPPGGFAPSSAQGQTVGGGGHREAVASETCPEAAAERPTGGERDSARTGGAACPPP